MNKRALGLLFLAALVLGMLSFGLSWLRELQAEVRAQGSRIEALERS